MLSPVTIGAATRTGVTFARTNLRRASKRLGNEFLAGVEDLSGPDGWAIWPIHVGSVA